eukprot:jgi/Mesen1/5640/ME000285S04920
MATRTDSFADVLSFAILASIYTVFFHKVYFHPYRNKAPRIIQPTPAFMSILVPPMYNSRRLFSLYSWLVNGNAYVAALLTAGKLSAANLVFWSYNLFGFLLPTYLPAAMKVHYEMLQQEGSKMK